MKRPSREEYYMAIAEVASYRSTCESRKVGCVIVKDDNPISFGYNGPARGVEHCSDIGGCLRRAMSDYKSGAYLELCPASHAEQNAIAFASRHGISTLGSTIYVNTFPCKDCMNSLINAGVAKVIYNAEYDAKLSSHIASSAQIEIKRYEGRNVEEILLNNKATDIFTDFLATKTKEDQINIINDVLEKLGLKKIK